MQLARVRARVKYAGCTAAVPSCELPPAPQGAAHFRRGVTPTLLLPSEAGEPLVLGGEVQRQETLMESAPVVFMGGMKAPNGEG